MDTVLKVRVGMVISPDDMKQLSKLQQAILVCLQSANGKSMTIHQIIGIFHQSEYYSRPRIKEIAAAVKRLLELCYIRSKVSQMSRLCIPDIQEDMTVGKFDPIW